MLSQTYVYLTSLRGAKGDEAIQSNIFLANIFLVNDAAWIATPRLRLALRRARNDSRMIGRMH